MITLELTEQQAKFLMLLTGNCAGALSCTMGIYGKLHKQLKVIGEVPDVKTNGNSVIIVDQEMIDKIKTEGVGQ